MQGSNATRIAMAAAIGAAIAGCATPVIMLKNDSTGQIARCGGGTGGFTGGGLIGQSFEKQADEQCARDYEARGFKRLP